MDPQDLQEPRRVEHHIAPLDDCEMAVPAGKSFLFKRCGCVVWVISQPPLFTLRGSCSLVYLYVKTARRKYIV